MAKLFESYQSLTSKNILNSSVTFGSYYKLPEEFEFCLEQ
jgi:hypothetical protein